LDTAIISVYCVLVGPANTPQYWPNAIFHYCNIRQEYCGFPILQHFLRGAGKRNLRYIPFLNSQNNSIQLNLSLSILNYASQSYTRTPSIPCTVGKNTVGSHSSHRNPPAFSHIVGFSFSSQKFWENTSRSIVAAGSMATAGQP
jgi:hypothetical protein